MESNWLYFITIWGNGVGWYLVLRGMFICTDWLLDILIKTEPIKDVVLEEKPQEGAKIERKRGRPKGSKNKVSS